MVKDFWPRGGKRLVSIENKLRRRPNTRATQIQDIGGCRIIVPDIKHVHEMHALYLTSRSHVFKLHRTDDYIEYPKKNTGYRSLHLVYKYNSPQKPPWSNMRVELQIRSVYQHAWATAVEAVSFFTGQDLKAGEGDKGWLRFFLLMANWIAFEEGCSVVPGIPMEPKDFFEELESRYHESEPVNDNGTLYGIN